MSARGGGLVDGYFARVSDALRDAGSPLSVGEVAERIGARNVALTRAVLELMREGEHVKRHPGDVYVLAACGPAEPPGLYARAAG